MAYQGEELVSKKDRKNKNWHGRTMKFYTQDGNGNKKEISWRKFKCHSLH